MLIPPFLSVDLEGQTTTALVSPVTQPLWRDQADKRFRPRRTGCASVLLRSEIAHVEPGAAGASLYLILRLWPARSAWELSLHCPSINYLTSLLCSRHPQLQCSRHCDRSLFVSICLEKPPLSDCDVAADLAGRLALQTRSRRP